jgi:phosphoribosyl 1,2-cyclic phosphodiesterase
MLFDLGTGLRELGHLLAARHDGPFQGSALVSHLHWDHIQGLPFFLPILQAGSTLDIYGPRPDGERTLAEAFDVFMRPPYFPVRSIDLPGEIIFHELGDEDVAIGDAKVRSRAIPHVGMTNGYRVQVDGVSVAYLSDHQQPPDASTVAPTVLDLCDGVDLLVHDAQYTPSEFEDRSDWGHCTVDYAVEVAARCGVGTLALFHHDPAHDDETVDQLLAGAIDTAQGRDIGEIVAASEGLTVSLGG